MRIVAAFLAVYVATSHSAANAQQLGACMANPVVGAVDNCRLELLSLCDQAVANLEGAAVDMQHSLCLFNLAQTWKVYEVFNSGVSSLAASISKNLSNAVSNDTERTDGETSAKQDKNPDGDDPYSTACGDLSAMSTPTPVTDITTLITDHSHCVMKLIVTRTEARLQASKYSH